MGFPVLVKAALGGGGKGMKLAMQQDELEVCTALACDATKCTGLLCSYSPQCCRALFLARQEAVAAYSQYCTMPFSSAKTKSLHRGLSVAGGHFFSQEGSRGVLWR